jgi:CheY-like chemotaxis protein
MSRMWILVVDDQEPVRDLITDILVAEGHDVRTAENGVEALAYWVSRSTT